MATPWYIRKNDQIVGPFSGQQLRELALATKLRLNDYVRKGEDGEFMPAQQIKELFAPDNLANRPTIPNSGDHFLSTSRDLSPADTSARTVTPPLPSSANPQLTPNGSQPKSSMASEKVKAGLADLVSTAKQAKDLASAHARKTQITQMILPKAYLALGKHVFEKGKYQDQFSELFQRITDTKEEIARIATTNSQRPPATDLKGKLQAGAAHVMAQGQAAKLNLRLDSLLKQLGKQAFELHGTSAGPSELVEPITSANEEISRLDDQIEQLSSGDKGPLWQRLPLAVLFTVICWPVGMILVWLHPRLTRRTKTAWTGASVAAFMMLAIIVPKSKPQNEAGSSFSNLANSDIPTLRSEELSSADYKYDFSKDDFTSIPPGAVKQTRTRSIDTPGVSEDLLGKLETEEGHIDSNGTFVEHGSYTTWADKEKTIKYRTGTMLHGKLHGIETYYHANGSKSHEGQFVKAKRHGIQRAWHSNGKPEYVTHWIQGQMYGKELVWYENGNKKSETDWVNGVKEGKDIYWWDNGTLNIEAHLHLDLLHGQYSVWNKDGFNTHVGSFDGGRRSGRWKRSFPPCSEGRMCPHCKGKPYSVSVNSEKWTGGSSEEFFTLLHLHSQNGFGVDEAFSPRHGRPRLDWSVPLATFERVFGPPDIRPSPIEVIRAKENWDFVTYGYSCSDGMVSLRSRNAIRGDGKGTKIIVFRDF